MALFCPIAHATLLFTAPNTIQQMNSWLAKVSYPRLGFVAVAIFAATMLGASAKPTLQHSYRHQSASAQAAPTAPIPEAKTFAAQRCVYGYEDPCFAVDGDGKPWRLLSEADISVIKQNPGEMVQLYQNKYRQKLVLAINKDGQLTDAAVSAIFVTMVAYELMPYQGFQGGLTPITQFNSVKDYVQDGIGLTCVSYVDLVIRLYSLLWRRWPAGVQFIPTGWRQDSPVGNHVELIVTGKGLGASDLMLDPTFGVYATGTPNKHMGQYGVLKGMPLALGQQLSLRANQVPGQIMSIGASAVAKAISGGLFRPKDMIYSYIARPDKTYNAPTDFISSIHSGSGNSLYYQNTGNEVWITNADGLSRASQSIYRKQFASKIQARYSQAFISRSNGSSLRGTSKVLPRIIQLAGVGYSSTFYILASGNQVLQIGSDKQSSDPKKSVASPTFSYNGKIYDLAPGFFVEKTYRDVISLYDARGAHAGKAVFMLKGNGTLTYVDPAINSANEVRLETDVSRVLVGVSGGSATVLKSDGSVWRLNIYALYLSPLQVVTEIPVWQSSKEPNQFVSIRMTHSEQIITATRPDGSSTMTNASVY